MSAAQPARILRLVKSGPELRALESGQVGAAALDVFEVEPPVDLRLVGHPRVIATPHVGASTGEAQARVGLEVAEILLATL